MKPGAPRLDMLDLGGIDRETAFLLLGEELEKACSSPAHKMRNYSVDYYSVGDAYVIERGGRYFCSCGGRVCWHMLRIVLKPEEIEPRTLDDRKAFLE
jgi:hypothetical protein